MLRAVLRHLLGVTLVCALLASLGASPATGSGAASSNHGHGHLLAGPGTRFEDGFRSSWLDPAWPFRLAIEVRPELLPSGAGLTDFPLLLMLTAGQSTSVFTHAQPDGSDLVVTKGDGTTTLEREVVTFDATDEVAEIWFRADTLSPECRTFYLYYGNPEASLPAADGQVWKPDYLGVYHFSDDPGSGLLSDYGQHGNHALATNGWTSADTAAGAIGQGWLFNGSTHLIDGDALACADSSFTISAWFAISSEPEGADFAFQSQEGYWHLSAMTNTESQHTDYVDPASGSISWLPDPIPDTLLHSYAWTLDGINDTIRFYFDGQEQEIRGRYAPNPPYKVYQGQPIAGNVGIAGPCWYNGQDHFGGTGDEFRVHRGVQTPEWILVEYRNQAAPGAFCLVEEQTSGAAPDPGGDIAGLSVLRIYPSPASGPVTIELSLAAPLTGDIQIFDIRGRVVHSIPAAGVEPGLLRWSFDRRGRASRGLRGGIYFVRARTGSTLLQKRLVLIP